MEIITSHVHTDLDGLASMILAKKKYPNARLVFPGSVNENVKEVVTLYQNCLNIYKFKDVYKQKITKLILVDTSDLNRIDKLKNIAEREEVEVIAYDHHIKTKKKIDGIDELHIGNFGSNTAFILSELLKENENLSLETYEATILMMGIYADTGSLSFKSTTPEDMRMAAFLLENGGDLDIVSYSITKSIKKDKREILIDLLQNGELMEFSVDSIFISKFYTDKYIDGMDVLTNKVKDIENVEASFILIGNDKRISIIARSSSNNIRVNEILKEFNGGGHFNSASANLKNQNLEDVYENLKKVINKRIRSNKLAKDIMKSPVKTVEKDSKIKDVYKIMFRFGYNGIPVMKGEKLIGIISRRDIDRAMNHGFGNAPIRTYMTSKLITVLADTPMENLKKLLIENDIGRLPVLSSNNKLIGILTRSDVLRNIYEQRKRRNKKEIKFMEDIKNIIKSRIPSDILELLKKIEFISVKREEKVYLIGGIVRDLILGIENKDVDIVIEGNGMEFASDLAKELNAKKLVLHEKFKTAVIILEDDFKLDVASSRIEYYEYPSSLPIVEFGNIKQDLYRRDFTVNSMAIEVDYSNFGKLIDYFNAYNDLMDGEIKVLHNLSFIEDPTRIIRAIRFSVRYNFKINEDTEKFIIDAIDKGFLEKLTWKRVKTEIKIILDEKNARKSIDYLFKYNIISAINKNIKLSEKLKKDLDKIEVYQDITKELKIEQWLIYFLVLLEGLSSENLEKVFKKFAFSGKFIQKYNYGIIKREKIYKRISELSRKSELYVELKDMSEEVLLLLLIDAENEILSERIIIYIKEIKNLKALINGRDLIKLGYKSSPNFKNILEKIFCVQIDKEIKNKIELENIIGDVKFKREEER